MVTIQQVMPLLWWLLAGGAALYMLRQLRRYVDGRLRQLERMQEVTAAEKEIAVAERRLALSIAEGTRDATVALQNAELHRAAAEELVAQEQVGALLEDQLAAARRVLEARTLAEEMQAHEHIRAEHELARESGGQPDVVALYDGYRESFRRGAGQPVSFEKFLDTMRQFNQL